MSRLCLLRLVLVLFVLVGLVGLGWKGWRSYTLAQALSADVRALQQLAPGSLDAVQQARLQTHLADARRHASALRDEVGAFVLLTPLLEWVPTYGSDLAAAGPLLDLATDATIAADETFAALAPLARSIRASPTLSETQALATILAEARPRLERARLASARAQAAWEQVPGERLSPRLSALVERVGPLLSALTAGIDLALAAERTATVLVPTLLDSTSQPQPMAVVLNNLATNRPALEEARIDLERAQASVARIPVTELPDALQQHVQALDELLPFARDGLDLALLLPDLLGADGRRAYLLVNQNPDELRPTGGFIGTAGPLVVAHGRLISQTITPTDFRPGLYPPAPEPWQRYMDISLWTFRDANWSPDFPTAAQTILALYDIERRERLDHVIAITPEAVRLLLQATGPVVVANPATDDTETVAAETLIDYMRAQYNLGLEQQAIHKKDFVSTLLQALVTKLEDEPASFDLPALVRRLVQALDERHLLLYLDDPDAAAVLARRRWDGAVRPGDQDFLMVVGANMGYNKANPSVHQAVDYAVDLRTPAAPVATLTITHTHRLDVPGECRHWHGKWKPVRVYTDSFVDCYWDYLRVLIPHGSHVTAWEAPRIPGAWVADGQGPATTGNRTLRGDGPANTYLLSSFLVVPFGGVHTMVVTYRLPPRVLVRDGNTRRYQLHIQKQPGLMPPAYQVRIHLPPGAVDVAAAHPPDARQNGAIFFRFDLTRDRTLSLSFAE